MSTFWPMGFRLDVFGDPNVLFTYDAVASVEKAKEVFDNWREIYPRKVAVTYISEYDGSEEIARSSITYDKKLVNQLLKRYEKVSKEINDDGLLCFSEPFGSYQIGDRADEFGKFIHRVFDSGTDIGQEDNFDEKIKVTVIRKEFRGLEETYEVTTDEFEEIISEKLPRRIRINLDHEISSGKEDKKARFYVYDDDCDLIAIWEESDA